MQSWVDRGKTHSRVGAVIAVCVATMALTVTTAHGAVPESLPDEGTSDGASIIATTDDGRTIEIQSLTADEFLEAVRVGRDITDADLKAGEFVKFEIDGDIAIFEAIAPQCSLGIILPQPSVITPGRAVANIGLSLENGCGAGSTHRNFQAFLLGGPGQGTTLAQSNVFTVQPGQRRTVQLGRDCRNTNSSGWQSQINWGAGQIRTNWEHSPVTTLRCSP